MVPVVCDSTFSPNSLHQQLLELSQTISKVKVRCLHGLESVIYHYVSVPVPPMPPEVPTRNQVVPVCHMAQELYVMVDLCVLLFMWWLRGCGWNSRLSLQSIDYPISVRLYCVCKGWQEKAGFLPLIFLMVTKKWQNPRCQNHHMNHPYTPGIKLSPKPSRLIGWRRGRRRRITVNLMKPLWSLIKTTTKMVMWYPRRERDFPIIPCWPTRETLTRCSVTNILDHILMTTEDWEWKKTVKVLKVESITSNVHGITQIQSTSWTQRVIFQPVKKLHCRCFTTCTWIQYTTQQNTVVVDHNTGCNEFQYIHERESQVILAILKKRKKVSFSGCPLSKNKRPRLQSPKLDEEAKDDTEEVPEVQKTPRAKEV